MASIETYSGTGLLNHLEWVKNTLTSMHTFVNVVADEEHTPAQWYKLYYTTDSYLHLTTDSYFKCFAKNDSRNMNLTLFNLGNNSTTHNFEIVQSAKGDIMFRGNYNSSSLPSEGNFIFALCKCKHGVTGAESWCVLHPTNGDVNRAKYIAADDYRDAFYLFSTPGGSSGQEYWSGGYNPLIDQVLLEPLCAPSSSYIGENSYIVKFAKNAYYGDTIMGGKHYYFYNLFAMLDELT